MACSATWNYWMPAQQLDVPGSSAVVQLPQAPVFIRHRPANPRRVLMVCMPYQNVSLSSLSVAMLATELRERGVNAEEAYLHLRFAALLSRDRYQRIAERGASTGLEGELLFALSYHGAEPDDESERRLRRLFGPAARRKRLLDDFAKYALETVEQAAPELVGFTTSFHQTLPSLWLARLIKQRWPDVVIAFGGAACADPMGRTLAEAYPEIDHVVDGFGEEALLDLAHDRRGDQPRVLRRPNPLNLDATPVPDYDRFIAQVGDEEAAKGLMLAFESSRGCWWGQKVHCSFCGLNQAGMAYHSKSSGRVVREVRGLWSRYQAPLFATDTILSRAHLKEALPQLSEFKDQPTIFYEVKANMNAEEVKGLRRANVVWIQPGIESLNTHLLQLLRKGANVIQNLALLKWCREQGITVSWGLLCAIPGEDEDEYSQQIRLMKHLAQFAPPQGVSPVRIDRYSPYFNRFQDFGWTGLEPFPEYRLLHPRVPEKALHDLAYHFNGRGTPVNPGAYLQKLGRAVRRWQREHLRGDGLFWSVRSRVLLRWRDNRVEEIGGDPRLPQIIDSSHEIVGRSDLMVRTGCNEATLARLESLGILVSEGSLVINLAVRLDA